MDKQYFIYLDIYFVFCIQYKLKWGVSKFSARLRSITATIIWIATTIAFIPLLRILLRSFTCKQEDLSNFLFVPKKCYSESYLHLIYMVITGFTAAIYIILSFRFAPLDGDIESCDVYSWLRWRRDPDTRKQHNGSVRTADLAFIDHIIKVVMVAVAVYLIAEPEASSDIKVLTYSYIFTIIFIYWIVGYLI